MKVSAAASILAALFVPVLPLLAQLKLEPLDKSIRGVRLIGPDDPAYKDLAASLIPAAKKDAMIPFSAQSVIVSNDSGQPLLAVAVQFTRTVAGHAARNNYFMTEQAFSRPVMASGARRIFTSKQKIAPGSKAGPDAQVSLSASLDLVIYSDWRVAGPDQAQHLPRQLSEMRAEHDVCAQIGDPVSVTADTLGILDKEAAANVDPPKGSDYYAWRTRRVAEILLDALGHGNTELVRNFSSTAESEPAAAAALHR